MFFPHRKTWSKQTIENEMKLQIGQRFRLGSVRCVHVSDWRESVMLLVTLFGRKPIKRTCDFAGTREHHQGPYIRCTTNIVYIQIWNQSESIRGSIRIVLWLALVRPTLTPPFSFIRTTSPILCCSTNSNTFIRERSRPNNQEQHFLRGKGTHIPSRTH